MSVSRAALLLRLGAPCAGQGLTEYTLLLALIALALIVTVTQFGQSILNFFNSAAGRVP